MDRNSRRTNRQTNRQTERKMSHDRNLYLFLMKIMNQRLGVYTSISKEPKITSTQLWRSHKLDLQQLFFPFQAPMDKMRLVFPPLPAASLALLLYSVYCLFMPYTMALAVFAGSISGYIVYDMIHYYLHHGTPYGSYFRALKRYHVKHHYLDQQKGEWSLLCKEKCF